MRLGRWEPHLSVASHLVPIKAYLCVYCKIISFTRGFTHTVDLSPSIGGGNLSGAIGHMDSICTLFGIIDAKLFLDVTVS
jgi:hypothetical protein